MAKLNTSIKNGNINKPLNQTSLNKSGGIKVNGNNPIVSGGQIKIETEKLKATVNNNPQQTVTLVDDSIVKGGYHVVNTVNERNSILCCYRKLGMIVMVVGQDRSFTEYILTGEVCENDGWQKFSVDKNYVHDQSNPETIWTINHPLNKKVSVTVTDTAGTEIEGKIVINDNHTVVIEFNFPFSGEAFLN